MKKIIQLLSLLFIISCSNEEETIEKPIEKPKNEPIISYFSTTTLKLNKIEEHKTGKIAELKTKIKQKILDNGSETFKDIEGKKITYSIKGELSKYFEVRNNNEIHLIQSFDSETKEGNDRGDLVFHSTKIETSFSIDGKIWKNTQYESIKVRLIDVQDFSPKINGKTILGRDGKPIIVEHEDGSLYKQYIDVRDAFNPRDGVNLYISDYPRDRLVEFNNETFEAVKLGEGLMRSTYIFIKKGKFKGNGIASGKTLGTIIYAMEEGTDMSKEYNNDEYYGECFGNSGIVIGNILKQLLDDDKYFNIYDYTTKENITYTWMYPKEDVARIIAGLGIVEVLKMQNQKLDSSK